MSNTLLYSQIVAEETLVRLVNNLVAARRVNRSFENQFGVGKQIGNSIQVRKPVKYTVTQGPGLTVQNVTEQYATLTLTNQPQVGFEFSTQEFTLDIADFKEQMGDYYNRYMANAVDKIVSNIDFAVLGNWASINNVVGTYGTVPNAFSFLAQVGQRMDQGAVPQTNRTLILGPDAYWSLAPAFTTLFVNSVAEPALKGLVANLAGYEIFQDQNIQFQTVGNYSGTPVVNGANQTGSSLITNGWTASVTNLLKAGDVITVPGVYAVNPDSLQTTGQLQNFVMTANVNSDASGNATLPIYPPITITGAYATVTVSPSNGATITVKGNANTAYAQNIAFVPDCIGLATCPMIEPGGVDFVKTVDADGVAIRMLRAYDMTNDQMPTRIEALFGTTTFYPEIGCRLTN